MSQKEGNVFGLRKTSLDFSRFRDLTDIMEKAPPKNVPEGFTSEVMAGISGETPSPSLSSFKGALTVPVRFGFQKAVSKTECSFYFMITGYFYFILGLMMIIGLPLPAVMKTNGWLSFQPFFGLLLAAELLMMGAILYKKGDSAMGVVRVGTVLFAFLLILNGWVGALYVRNLLMLLFWGLFSFLSLCLVVLLGLAVERCGACTISSEVTG
jgi:hypothetical protein